jgi:hypothetical protein
MIFATVTETTPRPEAVTPDPFLARDLADWPTTRAREVAAVVPFSTRGTPPPPGRRGAS